MDEAFFTELSAWLTQLAWQALRNPTSRSTSPKASRTLSQRFRRAMPYQAGAQCRQRWPLPLPATGRGASFATAEPARMTSGAVGAPLSMKRERRCL